MLTAAQVLAQNNFGDTRTGGLAGPMGLFLIVVLGTVTVLLIRNMNTRLRRLPDHFPDQDAPGATGPAPAADLHAEETSGTPESRPDLGKGRRQGG